MTTSLLLERREHRYARVATIGGAADQPHAALELEIVIVLFVLVIVILTVYAEFGLRGLEHGQGG